MRFRFGGVEFGRDPRRGQGPLVVTSFQPGSADHRSGKHDRMGRDGATPGVDYRGAATWSWELATNTKAPAAARDAYGALHRVWNHPDVLGEADLFPLDYEVRGTGVWRRVYGKPTVFSSPVGDLGFFQGVARFGIEFEVLDPRFYAGADDGLSEHVITHAGEESGGVFAPLFAPFRTSGISGVRSSALVNDGDRPTPVTVEFTGPVRAPQVRASTGWQVTWGGALRWDERVVIDPVASTVTRYDGDGNPSLAFRELDASVDLLDLAVPPGLTTVFFSGADDSHRSTAILSFRPAYTEL